MSKFATLALLATNSIAQWADLAAPEDHHQRHYREPVHHRSEHYYAPVSHEGQYLAHQLGMEHQYMDHHGANSLDEFAAAMLDQNIHYTEEHLDDPEDIPTFHIVHSGDSEQERYHEVEELEPLALWQKSNQAAPPTPPTPTPPAGSSDSSSVSSEDTSESSESSSDSSDAPAPTPAPTPAPAAANRAPYTRRHYSRERDSLSSESSELSSSTSDTEDLDMPRKHEQKQVGPMSAQPAPLKRHEYEEKAELEEELAHEGFFEGDEDGEELHEEPRSYDREYDHEKFTQADLDAIREIQEHLVPRSSRYEEHERIQQEDVYTLAHSLDFAEQQLQDRLRHNLEMYHDLQKLRTKPHSEFTTRDLMFVKQSVCQDGQCFAGATLGLSQIAAIAAGLCSVTALLI